jgi:hypothetical protein
MSGAKKEGNVADLPVAQLVAEQQPADQGVSGEVVAAPVAPVPSICVYRGVPDALLGLCISDYRMDVAVCAQRDIPAFGTEPYFRDAGRCLRVPTVLHIPTRGPARNTFSGVGTAGDVLFGIESAQPFTLTFLETTFNSNKLVLLSAHKSPFRHVLDFGDAGIPLVGMPKNAMCLCIADADYRHDTIFVVLTGGVYDSQTRTALYGTRCMVKVPPSSTVPHDQLIVYEERNGYIIGPAFFPVPETS